MKKINNPLGTLIVPFYLAKGLNFEEVIRAVIEDDRSFAVLQYAMEPKILQYKQHILGKLHENVIHYVSECTPGY